MAFDLDGKVALVTGAAGGIGSATAVAFADAGARVLLTDLDAEAGGALAETIRARGGDAEFVAGDVTRDADAAATVAKALARWERLDCAFNNAGIEEETRKLADGEEALFDKMVAVNVKGVWLGMKHQIKAMLVSGGGAIVNTASVAGLVGAPTHSIYAATKHAVLGLTKSAAAEYGRRGIRVNAVCPGVIRTAMLERALERDSARAERVVQLHPIGRLGTPEEVANAVVWLCSGASGFVTGAAIAVDGGMTAV